MPVRLPLFPLGSVLLPGLVLPLHVFEPRYRVLVRALLALPEDARQFGVVAIRLGQEVGEGGARALHAVGCTAQVREVVPHEDGRFDLVTTGATRFRLVGLDEDAGTPYPTGLVELLEERDGEAGDDGSLPLLAEQVALRFAAYRERLGIAQRGGVPTDPQVLSYLVAAAAVLDLGDRQALLEEPDTTSRLRAELALLQRESALLDLLGALPAVDLARAPWSAN